MNTEDDSKRAPVPEVEAQVIGDDLVPADLARLLAQQHAATVAELNQVRKEFAEYREMVAKWREIDAQIANERALAK